MALPQGITKEFLDMTYPDQYYKSVIEPAKLGKGPVPSKIQMLSKAQPFKAMRIGIDPYLPKSMQVGYDAFRAAPTKYASTALNWLGKGITSLASLPAQAALMTLHSTPANAGEQEWIDMMNERRSKNYGPWTHGAPHMPNQRFKQQQLMNQRKQQMQQTIRQHEAAEAAKQKAAADAAAAAAAKKKYSGQGAQGGGGGSNIGGGQQTSSGIAGGAVSHGAAKAARGNMSGWGLADGGLIDFYRYGGFSG